MVLIDDIRYGGGMTVIQLSDRLKVGKSYCSLWYQVHCGVEKELVEKLISYLPYYMDFDETKRNSIRAPQKTW